MGAAGVCRAGTAQELSLVMQCRDLYVLTRSFVAISSGKLPPGVPSSSRSQASGPLGTSDLLTDLLIQYSKARAAKNKSCMVLTNTSA